MEKEMKRTADKKRQKENFFKIRALVIIIILISVILALFSCTGGTGVKSEDMSPDPAEDEMTMHFIDVGQADATLLVSQNEAMLIDAGNRDDAGIIVGYLRDMGVEKLRYIVFTHPHEDHIGAGDAVISAFDVDKVFMGGGYDDGIAGSLKRTIEAREIPICDPEPGYHIMLGECSVEFLGPYGMSDDENDNSLCLRITHGETSILFTGDAGSGRESEMIERGMDLESDILHAAHHGSSSSNSYYFLRQVNPKYVVISCGADNIYGHPHEETMSRLSDLGAEVFRTDEMGTVTATDDGSETIFSCEGIQAEQIHREEYQKASYIGNINSKKYHLPDCSSLPDMDNRVYFVDRDAAERAGYDPCGRCNP